MTKMFKATLIALGVLMGGLVLLFSITVPRTASAQDAAAGPTATSTDPAWLAFSMARDAITEATGARLDMVLRWDYVSTTGKAASHANNWSIPNPTHPDRVAGIDGCDSTKTKATARGGILWGWNIYITALNGNEYMARVDWALQDVVVCDIIVRDDGASAEPDATVEEAAGDLPDPVTTSGATGSMELGGHYFSMNANTAATMKSAGMVWAKMQVNHTAGMTAAEWKRFLDTNKANGFKTLFSVVGEETQILDPTYRADFVSFIGDLAALGVEAIEVWNEPNLDREWPNGSVNGGSYTALLAESFNSIKSKSPSTIVISAAPSPTGFYGAAGCTAAGCNDDVFMRQMAQAGAAQYMDCVGLHYNEGIIPPTQNSGDPRGEYPTYYFGSNTARGKANFSGIPICYTELGYLSPEGYPGSLPVNFAWGANTSAAEQAEWLAGAATLARQRGDVRMLIVWNVDSKRYVDGDPQGGYAIERPGGGCPACAGLAASR